MNLNLLQRKTNGFDFEQHKIAIGVTTITILYSNQGIACFGPMHELGSGLKYKNDF
jgi:hypothetical protein